MNPTKKDRIGEFFRRDEAFFIGRSEYISEFKQRVSNYSEKPLWCIHGVGGIGKSMLCTRLKQECRDLEYPHTFIDLADLRYRNVIDVLRNLAEQIPIKHVKRFRKKIDRYQKMEQERYESIKQQIINQGGKVFKVAAGAADTFFFPGLGFISGITIDAVQTMLNRYSKGKDRDFFLNAPETLSHSFIEDLEHSFKSSAFGKLPLVLFIDTYEISRYSSIDELFRALVRNGKIKVFYIFSGRSPLNWAKLETDEGQAWKQSGILEEQEELLPFTDDECKEYLDNVEIFDSQLRETIIKHTQCFPFFMWLATKLVSSDPEVLKDMSSLKSGLDKEKVAKFLFERIIERANLTTEEESLIYSAAIPRWFDRPTLGCLLGYNLAETRTKYETLQDLDFVRSIGPDRANYHQIVRDAINLRWQDEEPQKKKSMHRTLADYFLERHIRSHDFSCLLENYYHRFNIDFKQAFVDWTEDFKKIKDSLNMQDLTAVLLDFETYFMPLLNYEPEYRAHVFLTIFPFDWATTQDNMGIAYGDRIKGDRENHLEEAIACHTRALEVYTREAFPVYWATTQNNLGVAYEKRIMGNRADNLEEAIACYTRALEVRRTIWRRPSRATRAPWKYTRERPSPFNIVL
jgi:tetratricopeptide (TPR) repeat protein